MRPRWEREPGPPPPDLLEAGCLVTATVVAETQRALSESSKESFTLTSPTPVPTAPIQQMILEQDRELARPSPGRIALTRPAEIQNSEMPTDEFASKSGVSTSVQSGSAGSPACASGSVPIPPWRITAASSLRGPPPPRATPIPTWARVAPATAAVAAEVIPTPAVKWLGIDCRSPHWCVKCVLPASSRREGDPSDDLPLARSQRWMMQQQQQQQEQSSAPPEQSPCAPLPPRELLLYAAQISARTFFDPDYAAWLAAQSFARRMPPHLHPTADPRMTHPTYDSHQHTTR
eukprot:GHVT01047479.1.p1 GENE.GHVT01047479.1~~GHVT01047479.1.p1  ORF type:complete len:290 (+),score=48.55 GHVT01047479.1:1469-2338(+)